MVRFISKWYVTVFLKVGTGTGILAMFAAKYAKKVFAVEANKTMAQIASNFVKENKLEGKVNSWDLSEESITLSDPSTPRTDWESQITRESGHYHLGMDGFLSGSWEYV
jgi:hypothetical protein